MSFFNIYQQFFCFLVAGKLVKSLNIPLIDYMFRHMCLPALMCLNKGDYLVLCITCDFLLAQFNKRMIYILKIVTAATSNSKGI